MEQYRETRRRESYEKLYGKRFPNADEYEPENGSLFTSDSDSNYDKNTFPG